MDLVYPPGYKYSVVSTGYYGFAQLPAGVSAVQNSYVSFPGQFAETKTSMNVEGPFSGNLLQNKPGNFNFYAHADAEDGIVA